MTEKATCRKFSAEYKLRIPAEAEASTERGQIGALERREGLYASTLDKWRKQRVRGTLGGQKRGPKVDEQATLGLVAQLVAQEGVSGACRLPAVPRSRYYRARRPVVMVSPPATTVATTVIQRRRD